MANNSTREFSLMAITSILAGAEGAHFFSSKLPSVFTIKEFVRTPEQAGFIMDGLIQANIMALGLGGLVSIASKAAKLKYWWLPGAATALISGVMTWSYLDDLKKSQAGLTIARLEGNQRLYEGKSTGASERSNE